MRRQRSSTDSGKTNIQGLELSAENIGFISITFTLCDLELFKHESVNFFPAFIPKSIAGLIQFGVQCVTAAVWIRSLFAECNFQRHIREFSDTHDKPPDVRLELNGTQRLKHMHI